jgi:GDP-D-glucose phosphorylase
VFHVLTVHSITLALEVMNLSTSPHTKLAFNSLCAYASVNHQHWHLYYQPTRLALQSLPLTPWPDTPYYTFREEEYPALGWVWLLRVRDMDKMDQVAREVAKLTIWLTDKEVAHNVVMTRFD